MTTTEHTFANEDAAHEARRALINQGATVSLLGFDAARGVYAFDTIAPAPLLVPPVGYAALPPHTYADPTSLVTEAERTCLVCRDIRETATYAEYRAEWFATEYEGEAWHQPMSEEMWRYLRDSCGGRILDEEQAVLAQLDGEVPYAFWHIAGGLSPMSHETVRYYLDKFVGDGLAIEVGSATGPEAWRLAVMAPQPAEQGRTIKAEHDLGGGATRYEYADGGVDDVVWAGHRFDTVEEMIVYRARSHESHAETARLQAQLDAIEGTDEALDAIPTDLDATETTDLDNAEHEAQTAEQLAERAAVLNAEHDPYRGRLPGDVLISRTPLGNSYAGMPFEVVRYAHKQGTHGYYVRHLGRIADVTGEWYPADHFQEN